MIELSRYSGETLAVLGLARSGMAAAQALTAGGARVLAWDDSEDARRAALARGVALDDLVAADWGSISALVLSPGIPLTHPEPHPVVSAARVAGRPILGDIELFAVALGDMPRSLVIAVTGTNGKSTTAALIGHILHRCGRKAVVAGNIGKPVLALDPLAEGGCYVLELSSYQIDLTHSLVPDIAVLLNIAPDHLDRHGGMKGYIAAKRRLFEGQDADHTAVVGIDDDHAARLREQLASRRRQRVVPISTGVPVAGGVWVRDGVIFDQMSGEAVPVGDVSVYENLPGRHSWQNAAAAYATVRALGLERGEIIDAMADFPGLAHRLETVATIGGVRFINDSKATNADAVARALDCYDNIHWIVGGRPKADGIESLRPYFRKIRRAYIIGEACLAFSAVFGDEVTHECPGTLEAAVARAAADAGQSGEAGTVVLLSPACASFDQFSDFEARGDSFRSLACDLAGSGSRGVGT